MYTLAGGRWLLDFRYNDEAKDEAKDAAIDEARQLARRGRVEATKVVQEDYDEGTHFVREWTVYSTRPNRLKDRALDRFNHARVANNDTFRGHATGDEPAEHTPNSHDKHLVELSDRRRAIIRRAQRRQFAALLGKVIVIIIVSFGFATLTTLFYTRGWIA